MESTAMIGNGSPNILHALIRIRHLQCVGCDKKILWYSIGRSLGLVGTGWSSLALLGKNIHRQGLTEEVRAAESILQACGGKHCKSCLAALEPHTERLLKNSLEWCSASMMVLVAALGGSGAVSCPMVDDLDSYSLRHAN
jgi:hypothetical protein